MAQDDQGSWINVRLTTNDDGEAVVRVSWCLSNIAESGDDFLLTEAFPQMAVPYRDIDVVPPMLSGSGVDSQWWPTGDAMQVETSEADDGSFERDITTRDDGGT